MCSVFQIGSSILQVFIIIMLCKFTDVRHFETFKTMTNDYSINEEDDDDKTITTDAKQFSSLRISEAMQIKVEDLSRKNSKKSTITIMEFEDNTEKSLKQKHRTTKRRRVTDIRKDK